MNYYLKKGIAIGNAKFPSGKLGKYDKDTLIDPKFVAIIEKNIPYLMATGKVINELDSNCEDAEVIVDEVVEVETKAETIKVTEVKINENELKFESAIEEQRYEFLLEKNRKEQVALLEGLKVNFKKNIKEHDLIMLIIEAERK